MTDKDKMQFNHILSAWHNLTTVSNADDAIAEVALFMWQAAKESSRNGLEEKDRRIAELLSGCTRSHPHELMNPMWNLEQT